MDDMDWIDSELEKGGNVAHPIRHWNEFSIPEAILAIINSIVAPVVKKPVIAAKKESLLSVDTDSSSDEEVDKSKAKKTPIAAKVAASQDSSLDDFDSSKKEAKKALVVAKPAVKLFAAKKKSSSDDSDSYNDEEPKSAANKNPAAATKTAVAEEESSDKEATKPTAAKNVAAPVKPVTKPATPIKNLFHQISQNHLVVFHHYEMIFKKKQAKLDSIKALDREKGSLGEIMAKATGELRDNLARSEADLSEFKEKLLKEEDQVSRAEGPAEADGHQDCPA